MLGSGSRSSATSSPLSASQTRVTEPSTYIAATSFPVDEIAARWKSGRGIALVCLGQVALRLRLAVQQRRPALLMSPPASEGTASTGITGGPGTSRAAVREVAR